jgi:hypothetical protein
LLLPLLAILQSSQRQEQVLGQYLQVSLPFLLSLLAVAVEVHQPKLVAAEVV